MKNCTLVSLCFMTIYLFFFVQIKGMKLISQKSSIQSLSHSLKEINNTLSRHILYNIKTIIEHLTLTLEVLIRHITIKRKIIVIK